MPGSAGPMSGLTINGSTSHHCRSADNSPSSNVTLNLATLAISRIQDLQSTYPLYNLNVVLLQTAELALLRPPSHSARSPCCTKTRTFPPHQAHRIRQQSAPRKYPSSLSTTPPLFHQLQREQTPYKNRFRPDLASTPGFWVPDRAHDMLGSRSPR